MNINQLFTVRKVSNIQQYEQQIIVGKKKYNEKLYKIKTTPFNLYEPSSSYILSSLYSWLYILLTLHIIRFSENILILFCLQIKIVFVLKSHGNKHEFAYIAKFYRNILYWEQNTHNITQLNNYKK